MAHETAAVHPWPNDDGISRKLAEQYRRRGWVDAIGLYGAAGRLPTWFRGHKWRGPVRYSATGLSSPGTPPTNGLWLFLEFGRGLPQRLRRLP